MFVGAESGSSLEDMVYQGLLALRYSPEQIEQQVPINGGRNTAGGIVVDIVVYRPQPLPIMINGEYWHRDSNEQMMDEAIVLQYYGVPAAVIWGDECQTWEQMMATLIKKVGRP